MFKAIFSEREIKEKLSVLKDLGNNAYGHLLGKIEFNKLQRLKKMTRQMIKRYLARGIREYKKRIGVEELISIVNQTLHKKKILYISFAPPFNLMRQSIYLRKTGEFETILLMEAPWLGDFISNFFDTVYIYDSIYTLAYILKEVRPHLIHVQGSICNSDYFGILARLLGKSKVIFEFFDIPSLCVPKKDATEIWNKVDVELGFFSERFACERSDGLILGYSPEAVDILKSRYHINTPILEFHSYTCDEFISSDNSKYSDVDGNIHLVYGGHIAYSHLPGKFYGDVQFHSLIEKLTKQGIYFDMYTTLPLLSRIKANKCFLDYKLLSEKNQLFNFKKGLPVNKATVEFSKYDFGAMIYLFDRGTFMEGHNRTRMPGKVFTYLEAGLPILVSEELQYVAKLVKEYEIGIVVSQKDLDNLPEVINSYDREKLRANVKKAREELSMKKHIGRLINFYSKC
jgi:hypothetical protein